MKDFPKYIIRINYKKTSGRFAFAEYHAETEQIKDNIINRLLTYKDIERFYCYYRRPESIHE